MHRTAAVAFVVAACMSACSTPAPKEQTVMENGRDAALAAGTKLIAERYPDFSPAGKTATVEDSGDTWTVTYDLPAGMLGGAPVVVLTKALALKETYRTQ